MVAVVYTTIDDIHEARRMAHTLVEEQLVACVNIIPFLKLNLFIDGKEKLRKLKNMF